MARKDIPPMVRILPMDRKFEFQGDPAEKVQQDFFLGWLPDQKKGRYLYKKLGINAKVGSVFLFQYDNAIIASAELVQVIKFNSPQYGDDTSDSYYAKEQYYGAYYFEPSSIVVFDPITIDEMNKIWEGLKKFSNAKRYLDPEKYPEFEKLVKTKNPSKK